MIVKMHLETSGANLEKRTGSVTFKKGTNCFQLINFSHSKCPEIAFMKNKTWIKYIRNKFYEQGKYISSFWAALSRTSRKYVLSIYF